MGILAGDTFVDSNSTTLPAHTPTGPDPGSSWGAGAFDSNHLWIQANGACTGVAGFVEHHNVMDKSGDPWPEDYSMAFDAHFFTNTNTFPAITLRHATASNQCYGAQWGGPGGGWDIVEFSTGNPGSPTSLASSAYTYPGDGVTDLMILEVQGDEIRLFKNGSLFVSATDVTITAAGKPGFYGNGSAETATSGLHFEDLVITDFEAVIPDPVRTRMLATQQRMVG